MEKVLIIDKCNKCFFISKELYTGGTCRSTAVCTNLNKRTISSIYTDCYGNICSTIKIPDWCPLPCITNCVAS